MKKLTLSLLLILSTISMAYAGKKVTHKYCDKTVTAVTEELQSQVTSGQTSLDDANFFISLVNNTCRSAIDDGLSQKDYESLYETVKASDCEGINDDLAAAMVDYSEEDITYVANKITAMCTSSVLNNELMLILMYKVDKKLKVYGIR